MAKRKNDDQHVNISSNEDPIVEIYEPEGAKFLLNQGQLLEEHFYAKAVNNLDLTKGPIEDPADDPQCI